MLLKVGERGGGRDETSPDEYSPDATSSGIQKGAHLKLVWHSSSATRKFILMTNKLKGNIFENTHEKKFKMNLYRIVDNLKNKTVVITGASRGIGKQISIKCAKEGANVVMFARSKNKPSHEKLEGTLEDVAQEIREFGGKAHPIEVDLRNTMEVNKAITTTVNEFGTIDAIVNNASAIDISKTLTIPKYNLIMDVNVRATAHMILSSYEYLQKSQLGHVVTISPPISTLSTKWLCPHPVYSTSKYAMTMLTLGYSDVLRANTIWPKKLIATASTKMLEDKMNIPAFSKGLPATQFADTIYEILCSDVSGLSCLDDDIINVDKNGIEDIFT